MNAPIRPGRFKLAWCIAGIAVLPLTVIFTIGVVLLLLRVLGQFESPLAPYPWLPALAVFWLLNGICVGFLQKAIVKRYLRVNLDRWLVYSSLGALLAGALAYPCLDGACIPAQYYELRFDPDHAFALELSVVALVYLTVLTAAQCLALNRLVSGSWRWIAAHAGPLVVIASVTVADQMSPVPLLSDPGLKLALGVLAVTVASGIAMRRMLALSGRATKAAHEEWAYQPAAIESESRFDRSVWDDAR